MKPSVTVGRIRLAMARLGQPFLAGVLASWRIEEDDSVETMCIGFRHGRMMLRAGPKFVSSISLDELASVVCHEAGHVILGHVFHEPQPDENHRAMAISCETATNEIVPGPLPGSPVLLADFPQLSSKMSTLERYQKLKDIVPDDTVVMTLDNHEAWDEILKGGVLAQVVVQAAVGTAWSKLTPEQQKALPEALKEAVKACGSGSSGTSLSIGSGKASVPWQTVLRRYVGRAFQRRPVFTRPNRRFDVCMTGIVPGRARQASRMRILAAVDTSGSISVATLNQVSQELFLMSRTHEVLTCLFDDKVHAVFPFKSLSSVKGRGGTSFFPIFSSDFLRQHRPGLVIVLTDGFGKAPSEPPRVPVIWCLTPKGKRPVSWGREIRMA